MWRNKRRQQTILNGGDYGGVGDFSIIEIKVRSPLGHHLYDVVSRLGLFGFVQVRIESFIEIHFVSFADVEEVFYGRMIRNFGFDDEAVNTVLVFWDELSMHLVKLDPLPIERSE
jgi:hypothetical protein